ncbi:dienelactone hydrolase family protein [Caenispirillum salinarum]|uniref:dienelactone hydrolase family protein n=1 Tax=Caenispirillum salinarum TaxID=859058 RepID=UPI00384DC420
MLFAADVFGATPELRRLAGTVAGEAAVVIDAHDGRDCGFRDDGAAYRFFLDNGAPQAVRRRIAGALTPKTRVVGFSAGAAAAWHALSQAPAAGAVLFYGSRIRDALDRPPLCPVEVVLPAHEDHFDIGAMAEALARLPNVTVTQTPWHHGFMNPRSGGWDVRAAADWTRRLCRWVGRDGGPPDLP